MPSYTRPEDRDYDAFTLYADVITESSSPPTGGTNTYPLLFENIGAALVPPNGFLVPAPANYHLSIDYVNFANLTSAVATVVLQKWLFGTAASPYSTIGSPVFTQSLASNTGAPSNVVTVDQTQFRISVEPGFFLVAWSPGTSGTTTFLTVTARARWTKG